MAHLFKTLLLTSLQKLTGRWRWHQIIVVIGIILHRVVGAVAAAASGPIRGIERVLVHLSAHASLSTLRLLALQRLRLQRDHSALRQDDVVDHVVGVGEARNAGVLRRARRRARVRQLLACLELLLNDVRRRNVWRAAEGTRVAGDGALLGVFLVHDAVALAVVPPVAKESEF